MDPLNAVPYVFSALASLFSGLPEESALGVNAGISPSKAGFSAFYAQDRNQWNLGMLYAIDGTSPGQTDLRLGLAYNRTLTDRGLFAAAGLNLSLGVGSDPEASMHPDVPGQEQRASWRTRGFKDPELLVALGREFRFGGRSQFGFHADLGAGYALGAGIDDRLRARLGAGISYRFHPE
jgi:hypothetical protein